AETLGLTPAGVRRHTAVLVEEDLIQDHDALAPPGVRRPGRPARRYIATVSAHDKLSSAGTDIAVQALEFLLATAGEGAITAFAQHRARHLEDRYGPTVRAVGPCIEARARALAAELTRDGYAATLRPGPGNLTVQLCLGHCPVHLVAAAFPDLCDAETAAVSRLLGVHIQPLATLATGEHCCTIAIPLTHQGGAR
ncbi:MAG: transcriptional regulator, partial [Micrococcales bacterium]|nr:transcriptional regulator [Micrococcales bacterium]